MKSIAGTFGILGLIFLFFHTCSSDEANGAEMFIGEYIGSVYYLNSELQYALEDAPVIVSKSGEYWNFEFSNEIARLDSILFDVSSDGKVMMNVNADESQMIRLTNNTLQIIYSLEGQYWTAFCTR